MGRVKLLLILILVLVIAGGCLVLAYWDFPVSSTTVEKVLPDGRFPK